MIIYKMEKGELSNLHWCLLLTLGRTPVTPANRHKKNLKEEINRVHFKVHRFITGLL